MNAETNALSAENPQWFGVVKRVVSEDVWQGLREPRRWGKRETMPNTTLSPPE